MWSEGRRLVVLLILTSSASLACADPAKIPVIAGPWRSIAGNPNLGAFTRTNQQPVDFAIWQAADGTWQLVSCIRHTGCGGHTRLLYRWEGESLEARGWTPKGIFMQAKPEFGEQVGGLQAPHVVRVGPTFFMAYGDWVSICFATGTDGKTFKRMIQPGGQTGVFSEGPKANTRDAMLIRIGAKWHCYYTGYTQEHGYVYCRTASALDDYQWDPSCVVAYGGKPGNNKYSSECPHVVELTGGEFYLFRTQRYGRNAQTSVYHSRNPFYFGIDDDRGFVCTLPVAAPEIIRHEGKFYIAALKPELNGIQIAPLEWRTVERATDTFAGQVKPGAPN